MTLVVVKAGSWSTKTIDVLPLNIADSLACSKDGSLMALGGALGSVSTLDTNSNRVTKRFESYNKYETVGISTIAFDPTDQFLAVGPTS